MGGKLKKHNLHHLYHYLKILASDVNIMTSVTKLVLVPMHKWEKIVGDRKDMNNMKTVDVPTSVQKGSGPKASDSLALPENKKQHTSPPQPLPSPQGKEEGEGKGEKYIPREDMGIEKTADVIKNEAGVWRPLGKPACVKKL